MLTLEKTQAVLLAVMIGDAMGQPVETLTPEEILAKTNGQGVTGFMNPIQTKFKRQATLGTGDTTDDWQLTRAVAESLIYFGSYDQKDMARQHVEALHRSDLGWGGTTRQAVKELAIWFDSNGNQGRHPDTPAATDRPDRGGGNGVAMKIAPLALAQAMTLPYPDGLPPFQHDVVKLWQLTHSHPDALYTSYAYATLLYLLASSPGERLQAGSYDCRHVMEQVKAAVAVLEKHHHPDLSSQATLERLGQVQDLIGDPEGLRTEITPGFSAITSVYPTPSACS